MFFRALALATPWGWPAADACPLTQRGHDARRSMRRLMHFRVAFILGWLAFGMLSVCPAACAAPQAVPGSHASPAPLQKPEAVQSSPAPAATASLYGTVVGPNGGLLAGARIVLSGPVGRTTASASDGGFSFTGLPAGTYRLAVSGPGMRTARVRRIVLQASAVRFLRQIVLPVAVTATTVRVVAPSEQLAEKQLQIQIHQRVLGVLPNYFSSYDWNAVHLWPRQKLDLAFRAEIDPVTFGIIAAEAGAEQGLGKFSGYGSGIEGYAKRYGADYANDFAGGMIGDGLLPALLHQDPRYFYKGTGSFGSRAVYAMSRAILCRGDNKRTEFGFSRVLGDLAAGGISNLYYPEANRGAGLVFENGLIQIGGNAAANLIREFVLPALTSHVPSDVKKKGVHLF
jgi:Carboxypeptidase regulatory-like domain